MTPEYTIAAALAAVVTVVVELAWLRTGIFRMRSYWISMAIVAFFQVLVDGWLTKLSAPIVIYDSAFNTGWRAPFDIPVEDWLYGFALVTGTLLAWLRLGRPPEGTGRISPPD
jgi:lycopene cyclase domain-containing protein